MKHTHSVGFLRTWDRPVVDTPTWQHTTFKRYGHSCPRRDSNPRYQQASGRRLKPQTAGPSGSAHLNFVCRLIININHLVYFFLHTPSLLTSQVRFCMLCVFLTGTWTALHDCSTWLGNADNALPVWKLPHRKQKKLSSNIVVWICTISRHQPMIVARWSSSRLGFWFFARRR